MAGKLVLFDGNALVHRAFHALPPLTTSKGELVNGVFGFAQMIFKTLSDIKPDYWAIAFDKAAPTFRHIDYAEYKAQRPKAPDGLYEQFGRVHQLVDTLSIPTFELEGFEADDLLGTLSKQGADDGLEVVIVSGDADTMQLVGPCVKVLTPGKIFAQTTLYDAAAVKEKFGVTPEQLPDYKGLCGDTSDNIPGVPGIGAKTASKLLSEFPTIEELYAHLDKITGQVHDKLAQHEAEARKSKWLATIIRDVPVALDLERCRVGDYDREAVIALLRELEFKTLINRLPAVDGSTAPQSASPVSQKETARPVPTMTTAPRKPAQMSLFGGSEEAAQEHANQALVNVQARAAASIREIKAPGDYYIVDTPEALAQIASNLTNSFGFAIDLETDNIDAMSAGIVGISLSYQPEKAFYIPVGHHARLLEDEQASTQLEMAIVLAALKPALENERIAKYAHNGKYELTVLSRHGIEMKGFTFDTMVAAWLINPGQRTFNLTDVTLQQLGIELTPISVLIGKGKNPGLTMADVAIGDAARYAGAHADVTYRLMRVLGEQLREQQLWELFSTVEMPLVPILAEMEMAGVALDVRYLQDLSRQLAERIGTIEMNIYQEVGRRFNINSTQQLGGVLFDQLKLPAARKTKTGYSTDAEVLEGLRGQHPVVDMILDYRQLQKLKSTYVDALPAIINLKTGRIHTSFSQTGTVTGRLSSSDPNLQNIPIRTEVGRQVRRAFIVGKDNAILLAADYSQIELRILAHISQDQKLIAAFAADADIHTATASEVFGVPAEKVTSDMRRFAKTVNFGVIYGMSGYGLSTRAGLSRHDSDEFIANYFARYSGVAEYLERVKREASEMGYVTTVLGRRRYLPEINLAHRVARMAAERMATNMPIQGTAADIIKIAMIRLDRAMHEQKLRSRMILQVHDELVFEVPLDELEHMQSLVRDTMEHAMSLSVRLKVDLKTGDNWRDTQHVPDTDLEAMEALSEDIGEPNA